MSQSRAARLGELQAEIAKAAGHDSIEAMSGADRQRVEQTALLRLQHEVTAAKLVAGGDVATGELLAINDAITRTLPPAAPQALTIRFVGGSEDRSRVDGMSDERLEALMDLLGRIDGKAPLSAETTAAVVSELQAENVKLRSEVEPLRAENKGLSEQVEQLRRGVSDQNAAVRPSLSHHEVLPPRRALLPPSPSSPWGALDFGPVGPSSPGIAHGSEYLPPDRVDANGKRIND
jgi:hypothetical protein